MEVAKATRYVDLGPKLTDYERAGVREYLVRGSIPTRSSGSGKTAVRWFACPADGDGLYRSAFLADGRVCSRPTYARGGGRPAGPALPHLAPLEVEPAEVRLRGSDSRVQVVVTGRDVQASTRDLTHDALDSLREPRSRDRRGRSRGPDPPRRRRPSPRQGPLGRSTPRRSSVTRRGLRRPAAGPVRGRGRADPHEARLQRRGAATARRAARTGSGSACWGSTRGSITRAWSAKAGAGGSSPPRPGRA